MLLLNAKSVKAKITTAQDLVLDERDLTCITETKLEEAGEISFSHLC